MTRGKYAARATLRREDQGVRSEIESYQHAVKRLTGENKRLVAERKELLTTHKDETHRLRAMLDEGLSPEILALREELERQRDAAKRAASRRQDVQQTHDRLIDFTAQLLHDITGCTGLEAMEAILTSLGGRDIKIADTSTGIQPSAPGDSERIATLQRTRGRRSSAKVIDHLNAICRQAAQRPKSAKAAARTAK